MVLDFDRLGGDGGRLAGEGSDSRSRAAERPLCENSLLAVELETSASFFPHEVCILFIFKVFSASLT